MRDEWLDLSTAEAEGKARSRANSKAYYAANRERLLARVKAWALANPERVRANSKAYYAANRERLLASARAARVADPQKSRADKRAHVAGNPAMYFVMRAKQRARQRGLEFSIAAQDLVLPEVCPVLGITLVYGGVKGTLPESASLDRIDNSKGYVPGNVEVISLRANLLKRDATPDELRKLAEYYARRIP